MTTPTDAVRDVAVVTGAASLDGIGFAACRRFAAAGLDIAFCDRDAAGVSRARAALAAQFEVAVVASVADIADEGSILRFRDEVESSLGPARVVVNNAGINRSAAFAEVSRSEWDAVFAVNATGSFLVTQAFLPGMRSRSWGRVVFVSSLAAVRGGGFFFGSAHYAASKAAVVGLTRALARELGPDGITVNAVVPGYVRSAMTTGEDARAREAEMIARTPVGRVGRPEDVAAAIEFFASADSGYITGATLDVNGGSHIG